MLTENYITALTEEYRKEYPRWRTGAHEAAARRLAGELHPVVEKAVVEWLDTGKMPSVDTEKFSVFMFMSMRKSGFLDALECVNRCYLEPDKVNSIIFSCCRR